MLRLNLAMLLLLAGVTIITCQPPSSARANGQDGVRSIEDQASLIWQMAKEDLPLSTAIDLPKLYGGGGADVGNDVYQGMMRFWNSEIVGNLFPNIGQLLGKWLSEWLNGWAADTVGLLTSMLRTFFLNPNIALQGLNPQDTSSPSQEKDDISPLIHQAASVMYAIALDLLLVLFVLAIWRYWTEAAWRGGMGVMGAVGRLIFTFGLTMVWPTICAIEIEISNQMISAVFLGAADQVQLLDATMVSSVKAGLVSSNYLVAKSILPTFAGWQSSLVGSTIGGAIASVALVIFLILTAVLIIQLIVILVMKALQTVLLAAQFMFAPVFLIFFATPDTESVASSFIKSCVEVSLWTFVWVGLLKLMVILLFSLFSPWGKIIMAIAILQLMIQAPSFLARASISPISVLSTSNFMTTGLKASAMKLGSTLVEKSLSLASVVSKHDSGDFGTRPGVGNEPRVQSLENPSPPRFDNAFSRSHPSTAVETTPRVAGPRPYPVPAAKRGANKLPAQIKSDGSTEAGSGNSSITVGDALASRVSKYGGPPLRRHASGGAAPCVARAEHDRTPTPEIETNQLPTKPRADDSIEARSANPSTIVGDALASRVSRYGRLKPPLHRHASVGATHGIVQAAIEPGAPMARRYGSEPFTNPTDRSGYTGALHGIVQAEHGPAPAPTAETNKLEAQRRSDDSIEAGSNNPPMAVGDALASRASMHGRLKPPLQPPLQSLLQKRAIQSGHGPTATPTSDAMTRSVQYKKADSIDMESSKFVGGALALPASRYGRLKPPLQKPLQPPAQKRVTSVSESKTNDPMRRLGDAKPAAKHACRSSPRGLDQDLPQVPSPVRSNPTCEPVREAPFAQAYIGFDDPQ
jgi:hypothetical protein